MKKRIIIVFLFKIIWMGLYAQNKSLFLPQKLQVNAENLRFRSAPNTSGKIIGEFENGEYLEPLEIIYGEGGKQALTYHATIFKEFWIKVKRLKDGQVGYTYGNYLESVNIAYMSDTDMATHRVPKGNWYGIYRENDAVNLAKSANPTSKSSERSEFHNFERTDERFEIYICSKEKLEEGQLANAYLVAENDHELLKVGAQKTLVVTDEKQFTLHCFGEMIPDDALFRRNNERLVFVSETKINGKTKRTEQDLTKDILQYGELGYKVQFAGDLNRDGVPELIISEGDTHKSIYYFFMSNEKGELKLQSQTWFWSKC